MDLTETIKFDVNAAGNELVIRGIQTRQKTLSDFMIADGFISRVLISQVGWGAEDIVPVTYGRFSIGEKLHSDYYKAKLRGNQMEQFSEATATLGNKVISYVLKDTEPGKMTVPVLTARYKLAEERTGKHIIHTYEYVPKPDFYRKGTLVPSISRTFVGSSKHLEARPSTEKPANPLRLRTQTVYQRSRTGNFGGTSRIAL